jgi:hypothetical protein
MIPLVGHVRELRFVKRVIERVAADVRKETGVRVSFLVGTMIELPRAAVTAGEIAEEAEFFSFGTNDLTQTVFGLSRDDATKPCRFISRRRSRRDPFVAIDQPGVGALIRWAVEAGRATRKGIKVGICGEHGGEPTSVDFCHRIGLDYVSCSPFRVPIARLAAAHAVLRQKKEGRREPDEVSGTLLSATRLSWRRGCLPRGQAPDRRRVFASRLNRRPLRARRAPMAQDAGLRSERRACMPSWGRQVNIHSSTRTRPQLLQRRGSPETISRTTAPR